MGRSNAGCRRQWVSLEPQTMGAAGWMPRARFSNPEIPTHASVRTGLSSHNTRGPNSGSFIQGADGRGLHCKPSRIYVSRDQTCAMRPTTTPGPLSNNRVLVYPLWRAQGEVAESRATLHAVA